MTKHVLELAAGRRSFTRSLAGNTPSCVVLIAGAGTASFVEQELSALVSGGCCLSPEAARRAAVIGWALAPQRRIGATRPGSVRSGSVRSCSVRSDAPRSDGNTSEDATGCDDFLGGHSEIVAVARNFPPAELLSNGALLEASTRYWVPARTRVWLEGERVRTAPLDSADEFPLDELLTSLAQSWGPRSIAILPMEAGADGMRGVGALRAAGGLALPCSDELEEAPPHSGARLRLQSS